MQGPRRTRAKLGRETLRRKLAAESLEGRACLAP
jgi:hypothetical protein